MQKRSFSECFNQSKFILTEGAIGLRLEHEYGLKPDKDVMYASLIYDKSARIALTELYGQYFKTAQGYSLPIMLMTNTRRANKERVLRSAYGSSIIRDYTSFLYELISRYDCEAYAGGMIGCKGDAYSGNEGLSEEEAFEFHMWQIDAFRVSKPDFMYAALMPCLPEATGMAKALEILGLPYIISFMINRDGWLLDGNSINDAIETVDAATSQKPLCYMTNCVHPAVLKAALAQPFNRTAVVRDRFLGIQANASDSDPCALDSQCEVKTSGAEELARHFAALHREFPLKIYGGCCGTDDTHINRIAEMLTVIKAGL